jgi:GNAT superfamily N-acetyltransferase
LDESVPHDVMANVNTMFGEMAAYHPRDPHWYLPTIGIEPHLHRKGLGSALLTEALSRCDQEHKPAYLESSNPANMALYQRFGFETPGDIRAGHSPPMIPMLRGALWPALTRAIDVASHGIRRISTLDASLRLFRQGVSHVTEFPASEIVALRSSRSPNSRSA